ncbi:hypothetical protein DYY66_1286 [Candidatus Nitrosotalea sp. FS]|nr:hypothetical protein [Candidatus Nitrosotalea sp. FS]
MIFKISFFLIPIAMVCVCLDLTGLVVNMSIHLICRLNSVEPESS